MFFMAEVENKTHMAIGKQISDEAEDFRDCVEVGTMAS